MYWFVERKKIQFWQKAGVVVASLGLYIFTQPDFNNINPGDVLTLFSTIFWAFYITYIDVFTRGKKGFKLTTQLVIMHYFVTLPMAAISLLIFDGSNIHFEFSTTLLVSLAFNAVLASILVTFIHTGVQKFTTPVKAALIFSLEPVIATGAAVIYYSAPLKNYEIAGGIILISEIFPMMFKKSKTELAEV